MAVCPNCKSAIDATQAFCHACGLPLTQPAWASAPPPGMPPAFAGPSYAQVVMPRQTDGGAIASMIFGIVGLLMLPVIASIIALALGYGARRRIRSNRHLDGEGFATAGIVTGWIGVSMGGLLILIALAMYSSTV